MISAAGLMSFTTLTDVPAHNGAYSMSPSKSGGAAPMAYRGQSIRSPAAQSRSEAAVTNCFVNRWSVAEIEIGPNGPYDQLFENN
jgi:hypothetical protein